MEQWRDIDGFEGMYQVSDLGRVRSLERTVKMVRYGKEYDMHHKGRILKTIVMKDGYESIQIFKDSKHHTYKVHRLVAKAFLPNPDNLPEVNHKDGNKCNNTSENLEWCTRGHNIRHAFKNGLIDKNNMTCNRKRVMRSDGIVFDSLTEAARASGACVGNVSKCCSGELRHTAGYGFQFA